MPILLPINYVGGKGRNINVSEEDGNQSDDEVTGLDTLAWGNVSDTKTKRYSAHLLMAILVVIWVCGVFFSEFKVYVKVRQDYLTSAEHRLRASATTVLVNSIPGKWLSEEALRGLFDVFPGGIRNIWLNRDLTGLLDKISERDKVHQKLEQAETDLIKAANKIYLKQKKAEDKKRAKSMTKEERQAQDAARDAKAVEMANSEGGLNVGDTHETPHIDADNSEEQLPESKKDEKGHRRDLSKEMAHHLGNPLAHLGQGVIGAATKAGKGVDKELENTNGFVGLTALDTQTGPTRDPVNRKVYVPGEGEASARLSPSSPGDGASQSRPVSSESTKPIKKPELGATGNTVRKIDNIDDQVISQDPRFWEFWKPPAGGYASPVPQGEEAADYMAKQAADKRTPWQKFVRSLPFMGDDELAPIEYTIAYNPGHQDHNEEDAEWQKYLKKKKRPTHNLPLFGKTWLFGIPLITKKVDTIHWCREELARLNLEIEEDQKHPERYPLMSSAFIQFEHQVAAHMACQSTIHHIPKHMTPRVVEISPRDVNWDNMAMSWWQEWLRSGVVFSITFGMVVLWAIPVAFSASLGQLDELIQNNEWLSFLNENDQIRTLAKAVAGVLPAAMLALMLVLVPFVLGFLANFRGAKTGSQKTEFVQLFYFVFLFIQVFLVVSVASFFAASIDKLAQNVTEQLDSVSKVLQLLAQNLPKASNYFFSYMILQALSTSSATLLQIGTLIGWFILARMFDSTARSKWRRNTSLNTVMWGKLFPIYTNFACIGLVYSVIAPLISIFAIITFGLLWVAHRYSMLYVTRLETDTGGVLYPRALNQTFTGIYFMELCMAGLFFIVEDERGRNVCTTHGIVMLVVLALTVIYQILLNRSFSPLFRYLPITFEDEAVLRDEAFERAQAHRFGFDEYDDEKDGDPASPRTPGSARSPRLRTPKIGSPEEEIELEEFNQRRQNPMLRNPVKQVGHLMKDSGNQLRKITATDRSAIDYRKQQRQKDLEAQRAIGDALFGGMNDDIEDLTPDERDLLVRHAFKHSALRARRPVVWIPRDDLGISDDEIRRTHAYSDNIWISNEGTALDSKNRVVYGKNPPDFSEVDVINL